MTSDNRPTLVRDIMVRDVATIGPMATLRDAMRAMRDRGVKSLVVKRATPMTPSASSPIPPSSRPLSPRRGISIWPMFMTWPISR